jgi:uncharacterized protein (UPF0332 family)
MSEDGRRQAAQEWFARTHDALDAARANLGAGFLEAAVNRAYYAAFYAGKALLATRKLDVKKHKDIVSLVGETFGVPGLLPREATRDLHRLLEARMKADYDLSASFTAEGVSAYLAQAQNFVSQAERLLHEEGWLSE